MHQRCRGGHNLNRENSRLIGVIRLTDEKCNPDNRCKISFYSGRETFFIVTCSNKEELLSVLNILYRYSNVGRDTERKLGSLVGQLEWEIERTPDTKTTPTRARPTSPNER